VRLIERQDPRHGGCMISLVTSFRVQQTVFFCMDPLSRAQWVNLDRGLTRVE
jgi:hypothetical protein